MTTETNYAEAAAAMQSWATSLLEREQANFAGGYPNEFVEHYKKLREIHELAARVLCALASGKYVLCKNEVVGWRCKACRETGVLHCANPEECGQIEPTFAAAPALPEGS